MPLIPSPSRQRRRLSSRAAFLVVAPLFGALLLPAPAEAVLLWKRDRGGSAGPGAAPESSSQHSGMQAPGASPGLAGAATAALNAPAGLPGPREVANYAHELRLLTASHAAVEGAEGDAERARALVGYGNTLARLSRDGAAARAFADALQLEPGLQPAWNNLGSLLRRQGHVELSSSIFRAILAEDPESGLAWFNLGMALDTLRDWDGSDAAYVNALTYAPELWVATNNPLIVGNRRAQQALHRRYLARNGRGSIYLDDAR